MAHWAFRVNLILVFTFSDYRGPIYMGSNVSPWRVLMSIGRAVNWVIPERLTLKRTTVETRALLRLVRTMNLLCH